MNTVTLLDCENKENDMSSLNQALNENHLVQARGKVTITVGEVNSVGYQPQNVSEKKCTNNRINVERTQDKLCTLPNLTNGQAKLNNSLTQNKNPSTNDKRAFRATVAAEHEIPVSFQNSSQLSMAGRQSSIMAKHSAINLNINRNNCARPNVHQVTPLTTVFKREKHVWSVTSNNSMPMTSSLSPRKKVYTRERLRQLEQLASNVENKALSKMFSPSSMVSGVTKTSNMVHVELTRSTNQLSGAANTSNLSHGKFAKTSNIIHTETKTSDLIPTQCFKASTIIHGAGKTFTLAHVNLSTKSNLIHGEGTSSSFLINNEFTSSYKSTDKPMLLPNQMPSESVNINPTGIIINLPNPNQNTPRTATEQIQPTGKMQIEKFLLERDVLKVSDVVPELFLSDVPVRSSEQVSCATKYSYAEDIPMPPKRQQTENPNFRGGNSLAMVWKQDMSHATNVRRVKQVSSVSGYSYTEDVPMSPKRHPKLEDGAFPTMLWDQDLSHATKGFQSRKYSCDMKTRRKRCERWVENITFHPHGQSLHEKFDQIKQLRQMTNQHTQLSHQKELLKNYFPPGNPVRLSGANIHFEDIYGNDLPLCSLPNCPCAILGDKVELMRTQKQQDQSAADRLERAIKFL